MTEWLTLTTDSLTQFSSVTQSCLTLCGPIYCRSPGLPVLHQLPEFTQSHVHRVGDAIQPSHPLSSPSPPAFNLCQHQGLFQWVSSSHQVAKVLEFQLQHQSFQWIFRVDFLQDRLVWSPCCPRDTNLSKLQEIVKDREALRTAIHRVQKRWTWLSNWTKAKKI